MFGRTGWASVCVTKGGVLVHSYEPDCFETCTLHVWHALFLILEALPDCAAWFDAGSLKKLDRFPSVFSDQLDGPSMCLYVSCCEWPQRSESCHTHTHGHPAETCFKRCKEQCNHKPYGSLWTAWYSMYVCTYIFTCIYRYIYRIFFFIDTLTFTKIALYLYMF